MEENLTKDSFWMMYALSDLFVLYSMLIDLE